MSDRDYLLPNESKQLTMTNEQQLGLAIIGVQMLIYTMNNAAGLTAATLEEFQTILDTWKNL